jgi:hypothetical protein
MRAAIDRCGLDLTGLAVLTEAASGAYAVTPVIAAMAGAEHVYAVGRDSPYGRFDDVADNLRNLAAAAGVGDRLTISAEVPTEFSARADIVTNSGHLRPLGRALIERLPPGAVIALMYEAWEFRPSDIDLAACARHGVAVAAVNERHSSIDVFSYLGPILARFIFSAGFSVYANRIAVLCDNHFAPFLCRTLEEMGASVTLAIEPSHLQADDWDVVVVALRPGIKPVIDEAVAALLARVAPGAAVIQFWGDIDRNALRQQGIEVWPTLPPRRGHMAVLMSDIGPEPVIRLQAGGLRAAELVHRNKGMICSCEDQQGELLTIS